MCAALETFAPCQPASDGSIYRITRLGRTRSGQEGEPNCIKIKKSRRARMRTILSWAHAHMFNTHTVVCATLCTLHPLWSATRSVCVLCVLWFPQWPSERALCLCSGGSQRPGQKLMLSPARHMNWQTEMHSPPRRPLVNWPIKLTANEQISPHDSAGRLTGPFMAAHAQIFLLQNETMLTMAQLEHN
jgi:hypothetical protein